MRLPRIDAARDRIADEVIGWAIEHIASPNYGQRLRKVILAGLAEHTRRQPAPAPRRIG